MTDDTIKTDLITLEDGADLIDYFTTEKMTALIDKIEEEVGTVTHDVSTAKGRKEARAFARKISRSKSALEDVRKKKTEQWRKQTTEVNAVGKIATERLDALRDKILAPVTEFEDREAERVRLLLQRLDIFGLERASSHSSTAEISAVLREIEHTEIDESWQEKQGEAREAKAAALTKYASDFAIAEQREAQDRELEELRKEKAAREEAEQAERARAAAVEAERSKAEEEKARAEQQAKEAEERHQRELEQAKAAAAQAKIDAEKAAKVAAEAERQRIENEKRAEAEAEAKRKADQEHRLKIRTEIVGAIIAKAPEGCEPLVDAMIDGQIPHVKVMV